MRAPDEPGGARRPERLLPDAFWMFQYKVAMCPRRDSHDWERCIYAHRGERARRRHPSTYQAVQCPEARAKKACPRGDDCPCTHHLFEYWLHPDRYLTCLCELGRACNRPICFFAHEPAELRPLPPGVSLPSDAVDAPPGVNTARAARRAARAAAQEQAGAAPVPPGAIIYGIIRSLGGDPARGLPVPLPGAACQPPAGLLGGGGGGALPVPHGGGAQSGLSAAFSALDLLSAPGGGSPFAHAVASRPASAAGQCYAPPPSCGVAIGLGQPIVLGMPQSAPPQLLVLGDASRQNSGLTSGAASSSGGSSTLLPALLNGAMRRSGSDGYRHDQPPPQPRSVTSGLELPLELGGALSSGLGLVAAPQLLAPALQGQQHGRLAYIPSVVEPPVGGRLQLVAAQGMEDQEHLSFSMWGADGAAPVPLSPPRQHYAPYAPDAAAAAAQQQQLAQQAVTQARVQAYQQHQMALRNQQQQWQAAQGQYVQVQQPQAAGSPVQYAAVGGQPVLLVPPAYLAMQAGSGLGASPPALLDGGGPGFAGFTMWAAQQQDALVQMQQQQLQLQQLQQQQQQQGSGAWPAQQPFHYRN
ncbi:TZF6 [Scenedesmus sp. PABB004]|nr:TZF6 [Scenedesmus sp. PABB004]